jgi:hypothetical protein
MSSPQFDDGDISAQARVLVRDDSSSFAQLGSATGSPLVALSAPSSPALAPRTLLEAYQYHPPPASARREDSAATVASARSTPVPHPPGVKPLPSQPQHQYQYQYQQQVAPPRTPKPPPASTAASPSPSALAHRHANTHAHAHAHPPSQQQRASLQIAELRADVERRRASAAAAFAAEAERARDADPRMNAWMAEAVRALPQTPPPPLQTSAPLCSTPVPASAHGLALTPTPPLSQYKLQQQQLQQQQQQQQQQQLTMPGRSSHKQSDMAPAASGGGGEARSLFGFASAAGVVAVDSGANAQPLSARRPVTSQQSRQLDIHHALDSRRVDKQPAAPSLSSSLSLVEAIGTDPSSLGAYIIVLHYLALNYRATNQSNFCFSL